MARGQGRRAHDLLRWRCVCVSEVSGTLTDGAHDQYASILAVEAERVQYSAFRGTRLGRSFLRVCWILGLKTVRLLALAWDGSFATVG